MPLKGSKTGQNLKDAFAGESQAKKAERSHASRFQKALDNLDNLDQ